jgi:dihydroxyacetone kinase
MLAKKGRASYSGDRSIGTLDAGAVAVALMFDQIASKWDTRADRSQAPG